MIGYQNWDQLEFFVCGLLCDFVLDDYVFVCVDWVFDFGWLVEDVVDFYVVGIGWSGIVLEVVVCFMLVGFFFGIVYDWCFM